VLFFEWIFLSIFITKSSFSSLDSSRKCIGRFSALA
jgi:hypothetical protein